MADSSADMQSFKYQSASNVNVSNFVSQKLTHGNYFIWKAQMLCLMESQQMRGIVDNLFDDPGATNFKTVKQYDSLLKGWIFGSLTPDLLRDVVHLKSAREVWRKLQSMYEDKKPEQDAVSSQIRLDLGGADPHQKFDPIKIVPTVTQPENNITIEHKKKLFKATMEGRWREAGPILEGYNHAATEAITDDGNTMLHLAVETGKNDFVKRLLDFIDDGKKIEKKNSDGRTALHVAAIVGNTDAVKLLLEKNKGLVGIADHKATVPLLSAYYNMKLDTFACLLDDTEIKEGNENLVGIADHRATAPLGFIPSSDPLRSKINLLITLIFTKQYGESYCFPLLTGDQLVEDSHFLVLILADLASTWVKQCRQLVTRDDQVLMAIVNSFPTELSIVEALIYPLPAAMFYPIYQLANLFILVLFYPFFLLHLILWKIFATLLAPIKRIDKKKKDYINAKSILNMVCEYIDEKWGTNASHPCYNNPILEAARQGSHEVVKEILVRSPKTIGSKSINGHNLIQLAVINRSEKVYNFVCHFVERMDLLTLDSSKNNILHLAGRLAPSSVLNRTTGAAVQLQRELQWYKEVKKFMSPTELVENNVDKETPKMVFTREHKTLMKEGEKWMKTTAESCSITAALIITIVFAAAITVPGGSNQQTGIPLFRNEIAFTIFAVSDAISLFASSTALLVFLSILTARFSAQDFLVSLPRRLIIGLCTLFISTITMMVSFSAILFLVFCDQRPWMLAPIGGLACFPIAVIVTLQFPLVVDLIRSTYQPIFLADCSKSNMNMRSSFTKNRSDQVLNPTSGNLGEQPSGFTFKLEQSSFVSIV
ncbi:hypothetical protein OSB04_014974 [Centaurea solstitialis]|uniref:PGG domain-containing protein n=1 Tax=Centaurea solstitialis TaxID=347529 RepID=A0AA38SZQ1_9ASTR|nr:hypothetical protein OSB04_014974 [Centaurea solstitialis]